MDQEKFNLIIKCFAALIVIILVFTVVIPEYKKIDAFITLKTREFLAMIFQTSVSIAKKTNEQEENYTKFELNSAVDSFDRKFLLFNDQAQLKNLIKRGEVLYQQVSLNINVQQRLGFLYYMNGDFEEAIEKYELVLKNVPKRKRTFNKLREDRDYRSIERTLLELAALYYDTKDKEKMIDYYKQFLKVAYRDNVYRERIADGLDEKTVRLGIFTNFGGSGFYSYKKSIKELEMYLKAYPAEKEVSVDLAEKNFEVVNLFFDEAPADYLDFVNNAQKYFELSLDFASEQRKTEIKRNLSLLMKLKNKYTSKITQPGGETGN